MSPSALAKYSPTNTVCFLKQSQELKIYIFRNITIYSCAAGYLL